MTRMSFRLRKPHVQRWGAITVAGGLVFGLMPISLLAGEAGAECDQLLIPAIDLSRCVVEGSAPEIDAGNVVRYEALSSDTVDWLVGHRTSHGATFSSLTQIAIGDEVVYRGHSFIVAEHAMVNRFVSDLVPQWAMSPESSVVLQTSINASYVHVWLALDATLAASETTPVAPNDRSGPSAVLIGNPLGVQIVRPSRIYDSRTFNNLQRLSSFHSIQIPQSSGVPADTAAVFANVTVVDGDERGFAVAGACTEGRPETSNVNWASPNAVANLSLVQVENGEFCVYLSGPADVVVDLVGYAAPSATLGYEPVPPTRILDTRAAGGSSLRAGETQRVRLPAALRERSPAGVGVTVTVISDRPTFVSVHACGDSGRATSTVNTFSPVPVANSVLVPVDAVGSFCVTSPEAADVILDVQGIYVTGGARLQILSPTRLVDTRVADSIDLNRGYGGRPVGNRSVVQVVTGSVRGLPVSIGVVANVTSVDSASPGFLTAWDCADPRPTTSIQNPQPGSVIGSSVVVGVRGTLCLYVLSPSHVVVDIMGVWVRPQFGFPLD